MVGKCRPDCGIRHRRSMSGVPAVNNAAYWAAAEEELARRGWPRVATAEIEFRAGLDLGESVDCLVSDAEDSFGFAMWLCVDGGVRASMLIGCEP